MNARRVLKGTAVSVTAVAALGLGYLQPWNGGNASTTPVNGSSSQQDTPQGDSGCTNDCGNDTGTTTPPRVTVPIRRDPDAFDKGLRAGHIEVQYLTDQNYGCTSRAASEARSYPQDPSAQSLFMQGCLQGAQGG